MNGKGAMKSKALIIVLSITVLLLLLAVVVLATPLKEVVFAPRSAPTIELEIVEGELDGETGLYGYLVAAVVMGRPAPEVVFNRNDGVGKVERNHTLILLEDGESFLLQATASNELGSAAASLELTGGMDITSVLGPATWGSIEGHIVYPSLGVPPDLQVVAENLSTGQEYSAGGVITDSKYATGFGFMIQVPPGDYHIYAFHPGDDYRAYYDEYVQSNYTVDSHEKIVVTITAGLHMDDVIVGNWWIVPETSNRPPVISGINFSADTLETGQTYTVTVVASDPDGDPLTHYWLVSAGSVGNFIANTMAWTTPSTAGNYQVTVTVRDGRGGEATATREVTLYQTMPLLSVVSLNPVLMGETGTITQGSSDVYLYGVFAGDSTTNRIVRGFISFDIGGLAGKTVHSAELRLAEPDVQGNPSFMHGIGSLKGLCLISTQWGARPLQLADYSLPGQIIAAYTEYDITHSAVAGEPLVDYLQQRIDNGEPRFQVRVEFNHEYSDNDGVADLVKYQIPHNITLEVTYVLASSP